MAAELDRPINRRVIGDDSPKHEHNLSDLAVFLGARPDMADRDEYLFFLTASMVFSLGVLGFLGYIYPDPVRERLYQIVLDRERIRAKDLPACWLLP